MNFYKNDYQKMNVIYTFDNVIICRLKIDVINHAITRCLSKPQNQNLEYKKEATISQSSYKTQIAVHLTVKVLFMMKKQLIFTYLTIRNIALSGGIVKVCRFRLSLLGIPYSTSRQTYR